MPSSSQQARDRELMPPPRLPTSTPSSRAQSNFNRIMDVDFSEESLSQFDIRSEREANGNTIEKLTETYLNGEQFTNLRMFIDCVVDSLYRFSYRRELSPHCVSVRAAIEYLPYGGYSRDTIRLKYTEQSSSAPPHDPQAAETHLAQLWRLVVRRAEQKYFTTNILPTNIALDLGFDRPKAAISLVGPDCVGTFNLRDHMEALGNVIELGEFHPEPSSAGNRQENVH
ncbi:hypothetical protein F5X96DRAFT_693070 [Biscogniauxia mediterranea]|nr:hypothetical protein F5X96DRAFT_693070 [Biscogniauxia mediterranea]